nr:uncharacterized protein LOC123773471 isoform X2 [Procambarus clarkii]
MSPCTAVPQQVLTGGDEATGQILKSLFSSSPEEQTKAAHELRLLLNHGPEDKLMERLLQAGALPRLVLLLQSDHSWQLQNEAAWVLCNIACGTSEHTQAVVDAGAVPALARLLRHTSSEVCHTAMWALANVGADNHINRNLVLAQDVFTPLLRILDDTNINELRTGAWLLRVLCAENSSPTYFTHLARCVPAVCSLTLHNDDTVSTEASQALVSLVKTHTHNAQAALCPTFYPKLLKLFRSKPQNRALATAVAALQNLEPNTDDNTKALKKSRRKTSTGPSQCCVATRSTPKRCGYLSPAMSTKTQLRRSVMKTRLSTKKLMKTTPNHSASNIYLKKGEIFKAVEMGDLDKVEALIHDTGPVVTKPQTGCTLLHAAAANNQAEVVLLLLKFISPNIVNKEGRTPAHLAAIKGHTQVLRILMADDGLNHDKRDNSNRTYKDLLAAPLFEAVLWRDKRRIQEVLSLGGDPDYHAGRMVEGALARELRVTTARHLALTLHGQTILSMLPQMGPLRLRVKAARSQASGPDVYKMDTDPRGYVCILSYSSFKDRPDLDLEGSHSDVNNLSNVFGKMGCTGHSHSSLTAHQTKQVLTSVRDMEVLDHVGCAVFVISSHGVGNEKFLTNDMKLLTTEWVCGLFKDSECPRLKHKPKLFIFDFCCGYYKDQTPRSSSTIHDTRVEEPLRDMMCLYSSDGSFTSYTFTKDGTPFITALCRTLAQHAHDNEFGELYREFLKEHAKTLLTGVPQLCNFGFTKKFYFTPVSPSDTVRAP